MLAKQILPPEIVGIILISLKPKFLFNCLFVNRTWCRLSIPIIWKKPFTRRIKFSDENFNKIIEVYASLLNENVKRTFYKLINNKEMSLIRCNHLFNYCDFMRKLNVAELYRAALNLTKRRFNNTTNFINATDYLTFELLKLFFLKCRNLNYIIFLGTLFDKGKFHNESIFKNSRNSLLKLKVIHIEGIIDKSEFFVHLIKYCHQLEEVYFYLSERDLIMIDLLYNLIVKQRHLKKFTCKFNSIYSRIDASKLLSGLIKISKLCGSLVFVEFVKCKFTNENELLELSFNIEYRIILENCMIFHCDQKRFRNIDADFIDYITMQREENRNFDQLLL